MNLLQTSKHEPKESTIYDEYCSLARDKEDHLRDHSDDLEEEQCKGGEAFWQLPGDLHVPISPETDDLLQNNQGLGRNSASKGQS